MMDFGQGHHGFDDLSRQVIIDNNNGLIAPDFVGTVYLDQIKLRLTQLRSGFRLKLETDPLVITRGRYLLIYDF